MQYTDVSLEVQAKICVHHLTEYEPFLKAGWLLDVKKANVGKVWLVIQVA